MPNDGEDPTSWLARAERLKEKHGNGNGAGTPLAIAVKMLPTPTAQDSAGSRGHRLDGTPYGPTSGVTLTDAVNLLPTPQANLGRGTGTPSRETAYRRHVEQHKRNLDDAIALLPTPTSRDWKGQNQRGDTTCLPGAITSLPSDDGKPSPDRHPTQLTVEDVLPPSSSSG
jgi:hypothetical protein